MFYLFFIVAVCPHKLNANSVTRCPSPVGVSAPEPISSSSQTVDPNNPTAGDAWAGQRTITDEEKKKEKKTKQNSSAEIMSAWLIKWTPTHTLRKNNFPS